MDKFIVTGTKYPYVYKGCSGLSKYPFLDLQVGETCLVPSGQATLVAVRNSAYQFSSMTQRTFKVMKLSYGCRVKRTS